MCLLKMEKVKDPILNTTREYASWQHRMDTKINKQMQGDKTQKDESFYINMCQLHICIVEGQLSHTEIQLKP